MKYGIRMNVFNVFAHGTYRTVVFNIIMSKQKEKVFYAVGVGRNVGVYQTWSDCKKQVDGVAQPKYRKFGTLQEAEQFISKWKNKSESIDILCNSSQQSSSAFSPRSNDQGEHHKHQSKGDKKLSREYDMEKMKPDEKLQEKGDEQKKNNDEKEKDLGCNKFSKVIHTKYMESFVNKFNKNSDNHHIEVCNKRNQKNRKNKKKRRQNRNHSRNNTNGKKEPGVNNGKASPSKIFTRPCRRNEVIRCSADVHPVWVTNSSAVWPKVYKSRKNVPLIWNINRIVNQSLNNTDNKHLPSNWNSTVHSVNEAEATLLGNQTQQAASPVVTSYSSRQHYPASYLHGTYTPSFNRYAEIVNDEIWNIAAVQPPNEWSLPSVTAMKAGYMQGYSNNVSDYNLGTVRAGISIYDYDKNVIGRGSTSLVIKTSEISTQTVNDEGQRTSETDKTNEESQKCENVDTGEGKDTGQPDKTINDSKAVQQGLRETLKEKLISLTNKHNNENILTATDTLDKILDVVRVVLEEITCGNVAFVDSGSQESESNDLSKMKVPEFQECRKSNSFSGELEGIVANVSSSCSTMAHTSEGGGATDIVLLQEKVGNCERKVDMCVGKVSEILSGLTEMKNELLQLKRLIPRNCTALSKEARNINFDSTTSTAGFCRGFAMKCDTKNDRTLERLQVDSPRSPRITHDERLDDVLECEATPSKRKRTWEEHSSSSSQECGLDGKIKQECADYVSFTTDEDDYVVVYTDGSCMYNGTENAKAGIGIWFDDGHPLNVSKPLNGAEPTNNNAEIQAARIACELALSAGIKKLKICTDSEFLINCITKWVHRWKTNGWSTGANKPVKNRAELEKLLEVTSRLSVRWEKVAGHSDVKGNEMADRLANDGAAFYLNH